MTNNQRHRHTDNPTKGCADNATDGSFAHNALSVAQDNFRLLVTGSDPLSVDGTAIGHGLPERLLDLEEVKTLLLHPHADDAMKDAVWVHLVQRALSSFQEPQQALDTGGNGRGAPGIRRRS